MADFVYSLTDVREEPEPADARPTERGREALQRPGDAVHHLPQRRPGRRAAVLHRQEAESRASIRRRPAGADQNNPFIRHDVGTANLFDETDPRAIAQKNQTYQNPGEPG